MTRNILILFWLTALNISFGQNLINNPSFELAKNDSPDVDKTWAYFTCNDWFTATTRGTPDYFTAKRIGLYGVPSNLWGLRDAHSGIGYVGLGGNENGLYEYLEVKLNQKLVKDNYYCLSLYISPADVTKYSTNEIDYYLSADKQEYNTSGLINVTGYEKFVATNGYFEEKAWNKIESCFKAKGGEEFLTIGWFNENSKRITLGEGSLTYKLMYFYIDDVSLIPMLTQSECKNNELTVSKSEVTNYDRAKDKPLILRNINFESNKAQLLPSSDTALYKLANYLRTNPSFKTEIIGYTDNVGKEKNNILLSKSRAKAVTDFLRNAGVSKDKIIFNHWEANFLLNPTTQKKTNY